MILIPRQQFAMQTVATPLKRGIATPDLRKDLIGVAIRFAICDDEKAQISYLSGLLEKWAKAQNVTFRLATFHSAEEFLFAYEDDKNYDILLLDVEMGNMNGVELARQIRIENDNVQIIFITGFPDYMQFGYDVAALHYLMKPVDEQKFYDVLNRAIVQIERQPQAIMLAIDGQQIRIDVREIMYIEAVDHTVELTTKNSGKLVVKMPLYQLESELPQEFVHCHRSFLVNLAHIKKITKTDVIMDCGTMLPLSRRQYGDVNKAMMAYLKGGSA